MIDTGAARLSTGRRMQYVSYCRATVRDIEIQANCAATCHFGIGSAKSNGVANIFFRMGRMLMEFEIHFVDAEVPIILSVDDMDLLVFVRQISTI